MKRADRKEHKTRAGGLSVIHRRLIYFAGATVLVSGLLWLAAHFGLAAGSEVAPARHPLESWALWLHGAAAMGFLEPVMNH